MKEKYCSECKEKFQDGEVVATSSEGVYHHIIQELDAVPIDCSMKKAMQGVAIFERKIHYQGNFYKLDRVSELKNADKLTIEFNQKNTGDIIKGDLSGLAKKILGIF